MRTLFIFMLNFKSKIYISQNTSRIHCFQPEDIRRNQISVLTNDKYVCFLFPFQDQMYNIF